MRSPSFAVLNCVPKAGVHTVGARGERGVEAGPRNGRKGVEVQGPKPQTASTLEMSGRS